MPVHSWLPLSGLLLLKTETRETNLKKKFSKYFADHAGNVMLMVMQPTSDLIQEDQGQKCLLSVFLACRLLITFANSLDGDQDVQNVSPDLDPNCVTL